MIQWLSKKRVMSRWLVLTIIVLTLVSVSLLYCRILNLARAKQSLELELWHERNVGSIDAWDIPLSGPLKYWDVAIALLCAFCIGAAAIWMLFGRHSALLLLQENGKDMPPCLTVGQLRKSGLIGMWKDREDIEDSAAYARELREQAQQR